jgi:DNA-directed RNA polymerase subunit RPC12/RpoP
MGEEQDLFECTHCKHRFKLKHAMRTKSLARDIVELGIDCPHCGHWIHSIFETPQIKEAQAMLSTVPPNEREAAKTRLKALIAQEQKRGTMIAAHEEGWTQKLRRFFSRK